jgi:methyl-accepting chemotaxis protein
MINLNQMKVSGRLALAGLVVLAGMLVIAGYTLFKIRDSAVSAHKERLKDIVQVSKGVVEHHQMLVQQKKLSLQEGQEQAKAALRILRFGKTDYFFVYDHDGRALMIGTNAKMEGQVFLGKADVNGFKLWDRFVEIGKANSQDFVEYWFPRANETTPKPKLAYVASIPGWQWIIGTGVYVDDVNETVISAAKQYAAMSLFALGLIAFVAWKVSKSIVNQLGGEPFEAAQKMRSIADGDLNVDIPVSEDDTSSMMASLKVMQIKLRNLTTAIQDDAISLANHVKHFDYLIKSYVDNKSDENLLSITRSVRKLSKTAGTLQESTSRFALES